MKNKLKICASAFSFLAFGLFSVAVLSSCTESAFRSSSGEGAAPKPSPEVGKKSPNEPEKPKNPTVIATATPPKPVTPPPPPFVQIGKSLDLYVIMDKSGSLYIDPSTPDVMNSGSDVSCKRFDALLKLVDTLRGKLTQGEMVRLSLVTFSREGAQLGTLNNVINLSRQTIDSKFRAGVCDKPDYETTNYERGISLALDSYANNKAQKKLDVESIVFFSDGAAKDENTQVLENSIARLNSVFPRRIYGVLLGNTSDKCVLKDAAGRNLQTRDCMMRVVGNESAKLLSVDDASGLEAAWVSLVGK